MWVLNAIHGIRQHLSLIRHFDRERVFHEFP